MQIKLDFSIDSPEERKKLVEKILEENPNPNEKYLEILADYLVFCMEKEEKKMKNILTDNRLITVNKREMSFEGLVEQLENGEDGIYNFIQNDKNVIFQPKISITKNDLKEIPLLQQLRDSINDWDKALKKSSGKKAFIIKKSLIEMRKDQYIIKQAYRKTIHFNKITKSSQVKPKLTEKAEIKKDKETKQFEINYDGISLFDYKIVSAILCNYSKLKEDSYDDFTSDTWYLMHDFDRISDKILSKHPVYKRIVECKIDGKQNTYIQEMLYDEFKIKYSSEYISNLWRNKIPKLIAKQAEEEYLIWYWKKNNLPMKKCSKCGQLKPTHNNFFSKNKASKDSFYSICKECRNKK